MTWFSEYSATPRRSLARSAIRCPSVDRFAEFRVPSRVSGQRFSLRGASLSSVGSRRARFPDLTSTMKALRLPARAFPTPYGFGVGFHMLPCVRARRGAPGTAGNRVQAWGPWSAGQPRSGIRMWARTGSLRFPGAPSHTFARLSDPGRTDGTSPFAVPLMLPPGPTRRRLQHAHDIGAQPRALVSAAYASRAALPSPMQGSLPAGGLRLYREGVEPSGPRRKVSGYIRSPFQDFS
jgi:hypothetical protein